MDRTALPPGTRLAELEILRVLAVGGFGIVYLARDRSLDRDVAVKEFMPAQLVERSDGPQVSVRSAAHALTYALGLQSFIDEAKLLARLSHPAVVKVYRFWEANGTGYMVMPYLRGPTLGDVRRSMSEPPTETWLRSVIDPLLDALAMLHAEGYYHRDISPENVLVSGAGMPVLLDFGAARRVIGDRTQSITAILKPHYAPIEQYAEATQLRQGPWTDLYALAALVAYLLDGAPPPAATARSVHDEMEPLAARRIRAVSPRFLASIDWALSVHPKDRPQSAAELRDAFDGRSAPRMRRRARREPGPAPAAVTSRALAPATYPATVRMPQRIALPALPPDTILSQRRPVKRQWHFPAAWMLVAVALAWPLAELPLDDGAGDPAPLARAAAADIAPPLPAPPPVAKAEPFARAKAGASILVKTGPAEPAQAEQLRTVQAEPSDDSSAASPVDDVSLRVAPSAETPRPLGRVSALSGAATKPKALERRKLARERRLAPTRTATAWRAAGPGPNQLCADRNFFMRPWCIQRLCDEPRFKSHAQCVALRPEARYSHH